MRQAGQSDAAQQLAETEASSYNTALARVEQQAKADAKKAKKQRQKAKKQLTQTPPQAAALAPRSAERDSDTSRALSTEPEPSARGSSEAPGDTAAPVEQSHAAEVNAVRLHGGQATSRDSTDAHMLDIFRCPISKVSKSEPLFFLCQTNAIYGNVMNVIIQRCGSHSFHGHLTLVM